MFIPCEFHTEHDLPTLESFLDQVEQKFNETLAAYRRTIRAMDYHPDMRTTEFNFRVSNGRGSSSAELFDEMEY